jgi:hypothetical protein
MRKLPVFRSTGEVLSGVTRHYFQLLFAAWPAVLVTFALEWVTYFILEAMVSDLFQEEPAAKVEFENFDEAIAFFRDHSTELLIIAGYFLAVLLVGAIAAVRWHRLVLLGEGAGSPVRHLRAEDGRYIWTAIKIWLIFLSGFVALLLLLVLFSWQNAGPLMLIVLPVVIIGMFAAGIAFLRMSLALPDAAVGRGGRVRAVFKASSGNGFRLLGFSIVLSLASLIPLLIVGLVGVIFYLLMEQRGLQNHWIVGSIAYVANVGLSFYFAMLQITMLSVAYREIIGLPGEPPAESSPPPS